MKINHKKIIPLCLICLFAFFSTSLAIANDVLPVPNLEGRVTDKTNTLSTIDREEITKLLSEYEKETTHQIGVLLIQTLNGESLESYSLRVVNSWQLGQKGVDNGVLLTLVMKERKIRIELGSGMEKYISDAQAKSIIVDTMVPSFKKGNFAKGLKDGLLQIMDKARNFVVPTIDNKR
jgi:uncharacterized protein